MPQSLANVLVHLVFFSTKERRALLQNSDLRDEMHSIPCGRFRQSGMSRNHRGRCDRSRPSSGQPIADNHLGRMGERTKTGLVSLGKEKKPAMEPISMAGGRRALFPSASRKKSECGSISEYREKHQDDCLPGRIPADAKKTRCPVRRTIHFAVIEAFPQPCRGKSDDCDHSVRVAAKAATPGYPLKPWANSQVTSQRSPGITELLPCLISNNATLARRA